MFRHNIGTPCVEVGVCLLLMTSLTFPFQSQTDRIKAVAGYVRALKSEHDLDEIGKDVFKYVVKTNHFFHEKIFLSFQ